MCLQSYQYCTVILFFLCLNSLLNARETHIVGDTYGWTDSTNFSSWTAGKEFHVGDLLVFNYDNMVHNVLQVNSTAYEGCIKDTYAEKFDGGNDTLLLSEVGKYWFICGVSDHCENGQKLGIVAIP
ncbi:hypothetical protein L6164_006320 [Bauhinia variegata]|uniref:Uncharacterized protein n=1 Tax=Bauhinia variegata TaxID=167791 RepID=A0ACB9PTF9_BAUVA|nr:hypothetical protein L6164_006320 [Bauhinia variegata]